MSSVRVLQHLPENAVYDKIPSPVGDLWLVASDEGLHIITWGKDFKDPKSKKALSKIKKAPRHKIISQTKKQLGEYFKGKRKEFDIPLVMDGTTFQKQAWKQLTKIPYGKTFSYQKQASRLGDLKKARAVGTANSKNPISIVVPCHRVIAKNGSLSGFGGGVNRKQFLLDLEKNYSNQ